MTSDNHNIYQPASKAAIRKSIHLVHRNGKHRIVRLGFCWAGFFAPPLWAMSEGLWRCFAWSIAGLTVAKVSETVMDYCTLTYHHAAIPYAALLRAISTSSYFVGMVYFGIRGQDLLVDDLLAHGYAEEGQHPVFAIEE